MTRPKFNFKFLTRVRVKPCSKELPVSNHLLKKNFSLFYEDLVNKKSHWYDSSQLLDWSVMWPSEARASKFQTDISNAESKIQQSLCREKNLRFDVLYHPKAQIQGNFSDLWSRNKPSHIDFKVHIYISIVYEIVNRRKWNLDFISALNHHNL